MNGVKVLILANRGRQSDDDPSHHLFFVEAPDCRQGGQERDNGRRTPAAPPTSPRPPQPQRNGFKPYAGADNDMPPWER
jgi:hypothetical protein